jgi:oligopeptide/dipeptide ABC transporter ATP-binding protein
MATPDAPSQASVSRAALSARDLVVEVAAGGGWRPVVRHVSLDLARGEVTALVGETGSGKTMSGLALIGLLPPSARRASGTIFLGDDDVSSADAQAGARGRRISMIFQDPMTALNPVLTIGFQITEPMRAHLGIDARAAQERARKLLEQLDMPDPAAVLARYPHELSGGMRQRALIAVALACDPEIILADEPTTALDVTVQAQILDLLREQVDRRGLAVLLVTHDLGVAAQVADRIAVMYGGTIVEQGSVEQLLRQPNHPYTRGLLACVPRVDARIRPLPTLPGNPHGVWTITAGCRFAPRCTDATAACVAHEPGRVAIEDGHTSACWVHAGPQEVVR